MTNNNYLTWFVSVLFLFIHVYDAFAAVTKKKCGGNSFLVSRYREESNVLRIFKLYGKKENKQKQLLYTTEKGSYFFIVCVKDSHEKPLILFQEIKGLDAGPEDTYGVIDPTNLKIIVKPEDWSNGNQKLIYNMLGYQPPHVYGYSGNFFCCFSPNY